MCWSNPPQKRLQSRWRRSRRDLRVPAGVVASRRNFRSGNALPPAREKCAGRTLRKNGCKVGGVVVAGTYGSPRGLWRHDGTSVQETHYHRHAKNVLVEPSEKTVAKSVAS